MSGPQLLRFLALVGAFATLPIRHVSGLDQSSVTFDAGASLEVRCYGLCAFNKKTGTIQVGGHTIEIPRGYSKLLYQEKMESLPPRNEASLDHDLRAMKALLTLERQGIVSVRLPTDDLAKLRALPTVWLVGRLMFPSIGAPELVRIARQERFDEIVGMKVVEWSGQKNALLRNLQLMDGGGSKP